MILRGELGKFQEWEVMVDLFFYKDISTQVEADESEDEESEEDESKKKKWDA